MEGSFFRHAKFPDKIVSQNFHINILEMLSVILCVTPWGSFFKGNCNKIFCDNFPVCCVINSGRAHCTILQSCLRELSYLNAIYKCEVRAIHLDNRLADHLSRWHMSECHKQQFHALNRG